jgi:replicative DNA helicase
MDRIESVILRSLIYDDLYVRRVLPFLEDEYFLDKTERLIFSKLKNYIDTYNVPPTKESLIIDLNTSGAETDTIEEVDSYLSILDAEKEEKPHVDWLVERTESWCQEKAIHNAVLEVINILDGKNKHVDRGMIPKLLQDALAKSFDPHVGHDWYEDAGARHDFYKKVDSRIPFHLDYFNMITKNGIPNKTLNICLAGTNVGKSLFMCDLSANYLMKGKNVLYITLEMAEERVAERIDANLLDIPVDELSFISKESFHKKIERINSQTKGHLIIKEYPTAQAHVGHFRHLLNELWLKKSFKPDAIMIDYLNICASSRVKASSGMYEMVKGIAEELRGLAVEFNVPIWSATQMNRAGFNNQDPDLTNTSESFGLPATADFMFALVNSDELKNMNQLLVKILKNRYGDVNFRNKETGKIMNKFVVGVDKSKQKLYNVSDAAQDLSDDDPTGGAPKPKMPPRKELDIGVDESDAPWTVVDEGVTEPTFDIDLPANDRKFRESEEDAERRRNATIAPAAPYSPKTATPSAFAAGKKHNIKL